MSDLVREYEEFIEDLRADYANHGYSILSSKEFSTNFGFEPDLVVKRNNETTIVEVKAGMRDRNQHIRHLRDVVKKQGYRFELKILPHAPKMRLAPPDRKKVLKLIQDAEHFYKTSRLDLAIILAWIAVEICVRVMLARQGEISEPILDQRQLINFIEELGVITEDYLTVVRGIVELRNRLVHGIETETPEHLVTNAIKLADILAHQAQLLPEVTR